MKYEEAFEYGARCTPERIIDESSTDLMELLRRIHQIISEKQYQTF